MKRRITKIGKPLDCYHCGQLLEYPAAYLEASPGVGCDPEPFCSEECHSRSCTAGEGQSRPQAVVTPHVAGEPSVRMSLKWARQAQARQRAAAEQRVKAALARAKAKAGL